MVQWAAGDYKHVCFATRSQNPKKRQTTKITPNRDFSLKIGEQDWF